MKSGRQRRVRRKPFAIRLYATRYSVPSTNQMTYAELVQPLIERKDMAPEHAAEIMRFLIGGEATDAQIGGILLGLRIKGCTTKELAAFMTVMREKAALIGHSFTDLVDTCGTGGGRSTFNISTSAAIVAAAA